MKYLLIALAVIVIVGWLSRGKRVAGSPEKRADRTDATGKMGTTHTPSGEQIVRCVHCGVHFPASEAVTGDDGSHYCTEAHRRQGASGS